ncbi:Lrp/AsnC family transcriptional regulator [Amycolatopsis pithecellobii]|uniref:AsnC family transcriptional regulator n=1 Tax=Amycolatopsis pithecellobii TaxID=664692 RepID=A0A6N7YZL9_9PSEU|nr:Lrp/AsnC family transcriptional regulator [Amycolatopsis pithecellobii]MTD54373.1 AsnC family transcriptional regulator [Amycolatopsis pithecellobii]
MGNLTTPSLEHGIAAGQTASLDDIDQAMLTELSADARISVRALADRLNISRANAYNRLERLTRDRVITGFSADIDPMRAGLGTSAYVMLTVEQTSWRTIEGGLRKIPYVEHIALVGGDFDVLVLVRTPDNAALREIVLEQIQAVEGIRSTRTWLIFEEATGQGAPWARH